MNLQAFSKNFPAGVSIPALLVRLLEYSNSVNRFYSGSFELTDAGKESAISWFDGDELAASQFVIFGKGPDGSMYGYWLYNNKTLETAPIVFLGSEGVGCKVLANSLKDFLVLLAIGQEELGFAGYYYDWEENITIDENLIKFRDWLAKEFGISAPADGRAMIAEAQRNHPDLESWLDKWSENHFG